MWLGFSLFGFYGLTEKAIVRMINNCLEKRRLKKNIKKVKKTAKGGVGTSKNNSNIWGLTSQKLMERSRKLKDDLIAASPLSLFGRTSSGPLDNLKNSQTNVKQMETSNRASNRRKPLGSQSPLVRQIQNWRSIY